VSLALQSLALEGEQSWESEKMLKMWYRTENQQPSIGHIHDSSWSKFVKLLCEKAERAARTAVKVHPANTSKRCAKCGYIVKELNLTDRTFTSPECGWEADRDYNASLNILDVGLGRSLTVEGEPLPLVISCREVIEGQVLSLKQEALPGVE